MINYKKDKRRIIPKRRCKCGRRVTNHHKLCNKCWKSKNINH